MTSPELEPPIPLPDYAASEAAEQACQKLNGMQNPFGELTETLRWAASVQQHWPVLPFASPTLLLAGQPSHWQISFSQSTQTTLRVLSLPTQKSVSAYEAGRNEVDRAVDEGIDLIIPALGVAEQNQQNVVVGAASIVAGITGAEPMEVLGFDHSVSDMEWIARCAAVRDVTWQLRDQPASLPQLFEVLQSPPLAWLAGVVHQAAVRATAALLSGPITIAASLATAEYFPHASGWWMASTPGNAAFEEQALTHLRLAMIASPRFSLGEGVSALSILPLLQAALTASQ